MSDEPWKIDVEYGLTHVLDKDGVVVIDCEATDNIFQDDLQRIVACVNFCKGIPDTVLEAGLEELLNRLAVSGCSFSELADTDDVLKEFRHIIAGGGT
jgi:hypothetical protein